MAGVSGVKYPGLLACGVGRTATQPAGRGPKYPNLEVWPRRACYKWKAAALFENLHALFYLLFDTRLIFFFPFCGPGLRFQPLPTHRVHLLETLKTLSRRDCHRRAQA